MTYTREFSVDTFPWWSYAKDTIAEVRKHNKIDEFQSYIEDAFEGTTPTATQVNDFVWTCREDIYDALGIDLDEDE